jgi:dsDNA-specific endonuclease/ATPase MutS2
MQFEDIPGVGPKTAAALEELDDAERALKDGDVAALSRSPEISDGRATAVARGVIRRRHNDDSNFLATQRAREIYQDVLALLRERAVTEYATKRLATFYPTASSTRIEEARAFVTTAITTEVPIDEAIQETLSNVEPLTTPTISRVRDRCLATSDPEQYAKAEEAFPEISVEVVEDTRDLAELARSYSTVITLDERFAGVDVEGDVQIRPDAIETPNKIVPERILQYFAANRSRILAAVKVHEQTNLEPPCSVSKLRDALTRVDTDGTVIGDTELSRLTTAVADLDAAVATAESVANDRLREAIRERDVTIEGTDFLSLVEQGARVDSLFGRELNDEYDAAVAAAREHLIEAIDLRPSEADFAERAFPTDPTFPVEHESSVISRLRTELTTARDRKAAQRKREVANELATLQEPVQQLVRAALELDVERAIAKFVHDFECTMPTFVNESNIDNEKCDIVTSISSDNPNASSHSEPESKSESRSNVNPDSESEHMSGSDDSLTRGFSISGGRSPLLDVEFSAVEAIDYHVSGVTLLSGVNSGGKTSTLDLVAVIAVMAHMGFPVPADSVYLERFSELHYYAKTQGTLDAGAFESTLRDFRELTDGASNRVVLVDELESITEPGASAKIVAGILEALEDQSATAVFVSHLADEIREAADFPVAVDGIEAVGLEDGELIVNRSPIKGRLARSTPELIVEKLADSDGSESQFYHRLLQKF